MQDMKIRILSIMKAINDQAQDTIWITDNETAFESLWGLYLDLDGKESVLIHEFPDYA